MNYIIIEYRNGERPSTYFFDTKKEAMEWIKQGRPIEAKQKTHRVVLAKFVEEAEVI
jgi:hypothetical protein